MASLPVAAATLLQAFKMIMTLHLLFVVVQLHACSYLQHIRSRQQRWHPRGHYAAYYRNATTVSLNPCDNCLTVASLQEIRGIHNPYDISTAFAGSSLDDKAVTHYSYDISTAFAASSLDDNTVAKARHVNTCPNNSTLVSLFILLDLA